MKKPDQLGNDFANNEDFKSSSIPLNAYLTYVNLSLHTIIQDALDNHQETVLTF